MIANLPAVKCPDSFPRYNQTTMSVGSVRRVELGPPAHHPTAEGEQGCCERVEGEEGVRVRLGPPGDRANPVVGQRAVCEVREGCPARRACSDAAR